MVIEAEFEVMIEEAGGLFAVWLIGPDGGYSGYGITVVSAFFAALGDVLWLPLSKRKHEQTVRGLIGG